MPADGPEAGDLEALFKSQIRELYQALEADDITGATAAIDAIVATRNTSAVEPLSVLLEYPDDAIRAHSSRALELLTEASPAAPSSPDRPGAAPENPTAPGKPAGRRSPVRLGLVCIAIVVTLIVVGGIGAIGYGLLFPPVWTEQLHFKNSTGQYDTVTKYRNATDTTYANVSLFVSGVSPVLESSVDADPKYRSVEYAVALHNDAERRQINCSIVGTDMLGSTPLHAVVAFRTTDRGMVYYDPTAMNASAAEYDGLDFSRVVFLRDRWTVRQPYLNTSGERPEVTEYRDAAPVSYVQLQAFLAGDRTENRTYVPPGYTCLDYAATLHDRAEASGLKNGIVSVSFQDQPIGHAFNVFPTTDKGLVYVDDTGLNLSQLSEGDVPRDNIVYLESGKALGEFPITQVDGHLDYGFYLDMKGRMDAYFAKKRQYGADLGKYNAEVDDYNNQTADNNRYFDSYQAECQQYSAAVAEYNSQMSLHNQAVEQYNAGNTHVSIPPAPTNLASLQSWKASLDNKYDQYSARWNQLDAWRKQLNSKRSDLEARRTVLLTAEEHNWISYSPPGIVNDTDVYWG